MPGMTNASIATKCIDQMPPPSAIAAADTQIVRARPREARTRLARLSAVKAARIATAIDSVTRTLSCVPLTITAGTIALSPQI